MFSATARSSIQSFLQRGLIHGHLRLEDRDGIYDYGKLGSGNSVHVRVLSDRFWNRVFL